MEIGKLLTNLERRGFVPRYFETGCEAAAYICDSVKNATVGMGGSITIEQLGLFEKLSEKLLIIAGINKIAQDLPAAISRAKNIAAPLNAIRLSCKTPCALSENHKCYDCTGPGILFFKVWSRHKGSAQQRQYA